MECRDNVNDATSESDQLTEAKLNECREEHEQLIARLDRIDDGTEVDRQLTTSAILSRAEMLPWEMPERVDHGTCGDVGCG